MPARHRYGLRAGAGVRVVSNNDIVVRPIEVTSLHGVVAFSPTLGEALAFRETGP